jgi:hypothetical protein
MICHELPESHKKDGHELREIHEGSAGACPAEPSLTQAVGAIREISGPLFNS